MSLITRCPACKTMFKVVPDQLRISEGWVRCGQCDEIFDASAQMQGGGAETAQPAPPVSQDGVDRAAPSSLKRDKASAKEGVATGSPVQAHASGSAASSAARTSGQVEPVMGDEFPPTEGSASVPAVPFDMPPTQTVSEPDPQELSFMRGAGSTSPRRRTWARVGLLLTSLILCLLLAFQFVVNERDRIAAVEPGLKPWIEELCAFAECTVAPLKQIESVVIDSSSFNKVRGDVYRLNFSLKNTAPVDLALPAIELSLTDIRDQALVRRVFQPGDLGVRSDVLQAASEINTSLTLGVKTNSSAERIAGYRILAFYP
jgi:predicted Zn finger-like uncharacterized protein